MKSLKLKIPNLTFSEGFTLIELLVVIAIMGLLMAAVTVNFAAQRAPRNLRIAQNELVSNIRKIQSYSLSSRDIPGGELANYYVLKFDTATPTKYYVQAVYNASNPPVQVQQIETINLPQNIRFAITNPLTINSTNVTSGCALLAFQLPFGRVIENDGCSLPSDPTVTTGDDYDKIISFVTNGAGGTTSSDVPFVITLTDSANTISKWVSVSGITGTITFQ